jgi:hypothetical protein
MTICSFPDGNEIVALIIRGNELGGLLSEYGMLKK